MSRGSAGVAASCRRRTGTRSRRTLCARVPRADGHDRGERGRALRRDARRAGRDGCGVAHQGALTPTLAVTLTLTLTVNLAPTPTLTPTQTVTINLTLAVNLTLTVTLTLSKALAAQAQGKFDAETVPVETRAVGGDGTERAVVVRRDEGPREGTSLES